MTYEKSDWIYCRLVDRGNFITPRSAFWFGHLELCHSPEVDERCAEALRESMRAYAVSEAGDGWTRIVRARLVLLGESREDAVHSGSVLLRETLRLLNTYLVAPYTPVRETEAGYLFNLRTRSVEPLHPTPQGHNPIGAYAVLDDFARHPQYTLNMLLVTAPEVYGELGLAFRRCAHWRDLALSAEDESERLLLNWMAAECLAKLDESDAVAPRLLAAAGLPSGTLAQRLCSSDASALAALPTARAWRKRLAATLDRVRLARNKIVHSGYRHVDLMALLSDEERACAQDVLPMATRCLSDMALMAMNLHYRTLRDMWAAYPIPGAGQGIARQAAWFIERLEQS